MVETKVVTASIEEENEAISFFQVFGWVHENSDRFETSTGYGATAGTLGFGGSNSFLSMNSISGALQKQKNYLIRITFKRDSEKTNNFKELVKLERELDDLQLPIIETNNTQLIEPSKGTLYLGYALVIFYGLGLIWIFKYKKAKKAYDEEIKRRQDSSNKSNPLLLEFKKKRDAIYRKAKEVFYSI